MKKIRFQGQEWLLNGEKDGAICTPEQYKNFECSYAHLMEDGRIMRFQVQIGTIADIEFLGDATDVEEPTLAAVIDALIVPDWGAKERAKN